MIQKNCTKAKETGKKVLGAVALAAGIALVNVPVSASAAMTSLIDFSALATDVTPVITTAVTTAAGIGALILAAKLCWGFFKKFARG